MLKCISCLTLACLFMMTLACESYDFTVNDKLVYTPKPLFTEFDVADTALSDCLKQSISDGKISTASQLSFLNCNHAGITNLQGLETFTGIKQLKLSSNKIRNVSPISALTILESLYLDDNLIVDAVPLYQLPALQTLDLSMNRVLRCPVSSAFIILDSVKLPSHCR